MIQRSNRASNKILSLCLTAAAASILCNSAMAAAPETTRVIVAFKPGAKAAVKAVVGTSKARSSTRSSAQTQWPSKCPSPP